MKILNLCKPYLLSHKLTLSAYLALTLFATGINILSPYLIGSFLDALIAGSGINEVLRFCAIFGGLNFLRILKNYLTTIMHTKMHVSMGYSFNRDTIRHIQQLSLSYANQLDSAYMSNRVGTDTVSLIVFCIGIIQNIISNTVILVATIILLFNLNPLTAAALLSFLGIYAAVYFAFKKPLYNAGIVFAEAQSTFFSKLTEQFKCIKLIKLNAVQPEINARSDSAFKTFKSAAVHSRKINHIYSSLDGIISTIAQIVLFVIGGMQILAGNFTIGMFTIFTSYFGMMLTSCRYFFGLGAQLQKAKVAYNRIDEILKLKVESCGSTILSDISTIELRDLSFKHNQKDNAKSTTISRDVINNFSAFFEKGNIYALKGANGTGKSTLMALILGMYVDEYKGSVKYNGLDIREIDMVNLRKTLVGSTEQEPSLIEDSIAYNLTFDNCLDNCDLTDIKQLNLRECISVLNMNGFIHKNSLNFTINEKSDNTSGGEKQKISILKVLHKNPTVMMFDEPTSALDKSTTESFISHLQEIKKDKIIILITHDEYILNVCDKIYHID